MRNSFHVVQEQNHNSLTKISSYNFPLQCQEVEWDEVQWERNSKKFLKGQTSIPLALSGCNRFRDVILAK